jgi:hypothetical protein
MYLEGHALSMSPCSKSSDRIEGFLLVMPLPVPCLTVFITITFLSVYAKNIYIGLRHSFDAFSFLFCLFYMLLGFL